MKTIQMTFNDDLLKEVDRAVKTLKTTRSALIRDSVRHYLRGLTDRELEAKHREGYLKRPVKRGEFDAWETEHHWGE